MHYYAVFYFIMGLNIINVKNEVKNMRFIVNYLEEKHGDILPDIPYFKGLSAAVVDIETTGLSPARDMVYLIGVLSRDEKGLKVTQFLASDYDDEESVLTAFHDYAENFDILLNYNGTAFDIPFINKRSEKHKMNREIKACRSVDYMKIFKASYLPEMMPNLKLKTVEKYAGVFRNDKASGKECISLYSDFVKKGDIRSGKLLLLHNYEDLSCFPALNSLIHKIDIHMAMFSTGFPVKVNDSVLFVKKIKPDSTGIRVLGEFPECKMDWDLYADDISFTMSSLTGEFSLEIFSHGLEADEILNRRLVNSIVMDSLSQLKI